jgi:hypothetical protein
MIYQFDINDNNIFSTNLQLVLIRERLSSTEERVCPILEYSGDASLTGSCKERMLHGLTFVI